MTFTFVFTYFLVTIIASAIGFVLLWQLSGDMGTEQEVHAFRSYIIGFLCFTLSNSVWVWINYGYLSIPGTPFSMANLIAICVASYYWFRYVELRLNPKRVATAVFKVVSFIPLLVAIILVVTTPLTGLVFSYSESNEYIHGPLYPTMAVLAILYLLAATVDIVYNLSNMRSPSQRRQYTTLIMFLIFPVIGGIIDIFVPNLPIMELALMFGTVLVYTSMQQAQIYSDVLTGMNNRRLADEFLLERIEEASDDNPLYFFIGDIDNFKEINDRYGHLEGDRALKIVANSLRQVTSQLSCHIARWGGDEFVVIIEGRHLSSPESLIRRINDSLEGVAKENGLPYPLNVSIGYACCTSPDEGAVGILARADADMYEQKRAKRHANETA